MASYTRTYGANARAQRWDEYAEEGGQRTGNWLPLDGLDGEEIFAATPQLQAMPAPRREAPTPQRRERERLRPTTAYPAPLTRQHQPPAAREHPAAKGVPARAVAMAAAIAFGALALYTGVTAALEWAQVKLDDLQYGRPRTFQMDAYVGHGESEGVPSHFVAMNLNRRVTILELPGGDSTKATAIVGPYLFGHGEDLTPVHLDAQDLNADGKADLLVTLKSEQLIYLNDGAAFKLVTPKERAQLQKALSTQAAPAAAPGSPPAGAEVVEEAGK